MSGKAVVGLGKLGVPLAVCLAAEGHTVFGLDQSPAVVQALHEGTYITREPGLEAELNLHRQNLTFTSLWSELVRWTNQAFIVVPTPSTPDQPAFSTQYVEQALNSLVPELVSQQRSGYDIVLVSTVMPGACDTVLQPLIERLSPPEFRPQLVYSPEFIALGDVLRGMRRPDLLLVGSEDAGAGQRVLETLKTFSLDRYFQSKPPAECVTTRINAELAKLAINVGLGWKITLANLLQDVCEQFPGADIDRVTEIVGRDTRINGKYLRGGTGAAGPCLPRDLRALLSVTPGAARVPLAGAVGYNNHPTNKALELVWTTVERPGPIAIVGLSYRDGTPVLDESPSLECAEILARGDDYQVRVCDQEIRADSELARRYPQFQWFDSVEECVKGCRGILLAKLTDQAQWLRRHPEWISDAAVVVDCWRQLQSPQPPDRWRHLPFGRGPVG